MNRVMRLAAG